MKKLLFILLSLYVTSLSAQKEANNWFFGEHAGLSFETGSPVAVLGGQLSTEEGCTSISNSSGQLLFYTNGVFVYNKNHVQMPNGYGLQGDQSSTQSAIIVPKPGSSNIYFVFTVMDQNGTGAGLQYSIVDMSLEGGLGDVIDKNTPILPYSSEKVTAVKSVSDNSVLIITFKDNSFYVYKATNTGVNTTAIKISDGGYYISDKRGYLKASPDATKVAIAHQSDGKFILYDFDSSTGLINNPILLPLDSPNNSPYGIEFSADSKMLYVLASNNGSMYEDDPNMHSAAIYQYNLNLATPAEIIASKTIIDQRNQFRGALQLGPDLKIYKAQSATYYVGSQFLGVIHNPEIPGAGCNYEHDAVDLGGPLSRQGLPPFIQSFFASQVSYEGDCSASPTSFTLSSTDGIATIIWNFGDGTPTLSGDLSPTHTYSTGGNYTVTVNITTTSGDAVTLTLEVSIFETPIISTPVALKQCDDDLDGFTPFNLNEANSKISTNFENETFTYYKTFAAADTSDAGELIANPSTYINQTVTTDVVFARVESNAICHKVARVDLTVSTTEIPSSFQRVFYECDDYINASNDAHDGISSFNFSSVNAEVEAIFTASGQAITISYYRNEEDALSEHNPISDISNYRNIGYPHNQIIYIRVDSELNNNCLGLGPHITLHVEPVPTANPVSIDRECDEDFDGLFSFDTSEVEATVLNGQTGMTVTYTNQSGNSLPSPLPNPFITESQQITIRVTDLSTEGDCSVETILDLIVDPIPVAYPVDDLFACDDDFDGQVTFDTSQIESTLLNGQTGVTVFYSDQSGNSLPSPLPNPFLSATQTIGIVLQNSQNSNCASSSVIRFIVNPKPDFYLDEMAIVCLDNPPQNISISDATGDFNYEWTNENDEIISNLDNADVYTEGLYTVIATTTDGTECVSFPHTVEVTESIIPTIEESDIVVVDDSDNNSISINIDNLGIGEYEFAIDDISGPYQYEPYFDHLTPGIHTIFVKDSKGCGIDEIEVPILGFPKFFTPNNDTYNDTWKVLGAQIKYYKAVDVTIFDRYGKVLFVLDINSNTNGWDGFFNAKEMPSSDYWFSARLEDKKGNSRLRKGHFSLLR